VKVDELLTRPPTLETGRELLAWAQELRGRIVRGDMMIGILSVEEVAKAPLALERAASCGLQDAWIELARWYAKPPFGSADMTKAEQALRTAIAAQVPGAALEVVRLRWFYHRDEASADDRREAFEFAQDAVAANRDDGVATYFLGLLTCQGFGTAADPAAAVALQRRAASLGNADAMFELYVHLQTGLGVPRDETGAFAALQQAADAGHPRAMYNMGAFFATGQNVPKDLAAAVDWYTRASDAGNLRATAMLAVMYARGEGVQQDLERARELFDEADYMGFDTSELRGVAEL
jgi:TPR repeat protein